MEKDDKPAADSKDSKNDVKADAKADIKGLEEDKNGHLPVTLQSKDKKDFTVRFFLERIE